MDETPGPGSCLNEGFDLPTVAYISNEFPSALEPYVVEEIVTLRQRGVKVLSCSARRVNPTGLNAQMRNLAAETLYLQQPKPALLARAGWLCVRRFSLLADLFARVLLHGRESPLRRLRALLHTWLGAYFALQLAACGVAHIHVHHGYFASWVGMVAARLLGVGFSMTLHGSDLLLHGAFLDTKLENCRFCLTVSSYNRRHILARYPQVEPEKVLVQRLGVESQLRFPIVRFESEDGCPVLLSVGRLHPIKDHAFLIRACRQLKDDGLTFLCLIAGEGPERQRLQRLIARLHLRAEVRLLGHVSHEPLGCYYAMADVVVLTSRSEGIPLTLMEAMAQGKPVLAPAITGIPELVVDGRTGFLYQPGSKADFVRRLEMICRAKADLEPLCRAARMHVLEHFNLERNLAAFSDVFLSRIGARPKELYEDPVLQQI